MNIPTQTKIRNRTRVLLASTMMAITLAGGVAQASDNLSNFPNIFRAFEENRAGIDGFDGIDPTLTHSFSRVSVAADISRLPTIDRQPVLWGEFDTVSWPFYVTTADLSNTVTVTIFFQNAASVMPEVSNLELMVNGVKLGQAAIQNPASPGRMVVEVPGSALAIGHNALTVVARQHHRVDCSADATHELWTRIDVERSTIAYGGNKTRISTMKDLAGLVADGKQALPIRLHYPDTESFAPWTERSRTYFAMAQQAAIVRGLRKTDVAVETEASVRMHAPALDLFSGSVVELKATPSLGRIYDLTDITSRINAAQTNTIFVASRDKRRTLKLQAREIAHLPDAFAQYQDEPLKGTEPGIAVAKANAFESFEDTTVSMRELGYVENEFVGRRFAAQFGFRLPADFFPGSYDEIALHLFGAYSDGLKPGQRLLIRINGQSEISLPLNGKRGGVFEDKIVQLDLARFQPGYNEIELVAYVEKPSDDSCVPGDDIDKEPRFFLSGDSFLSIPKLAHLGRFPNLGATLSSGFPYRSEDGRGDLDVVMADDQPQTLAKAIDFVAGMAAQTDRVYPVRPSVPSSIAQEGTALNRIVVGGYEALPSDYVARLQGANISSMVGYWANPSIDVASANIDMMKTSALGSDVGASPDLATGLPTGSRVDLLGSDIAGHSGVSMRERFQRQARQRRENSAFTMKLERTYNFVTKPIRALQRRQWVQRDLPQSTSAVVGQLVDGETLTTIVGYAQTGDASAPLDGFFKPGELPDDLVQTAGLELTANAVASVTARAPAMSVMSNYSVRNVRLIIAGWLSNNPIIYGVLTMIAFLIAGFVSHIALNKTTRRAGETFETLELK